MILLVETHLRTNGLAEKIHSHENCFNNMDFVYLPKFLLEEFIAIWKQVESISPTFSKNAKILLNQVQDKVTQIEIQAKPSDGRNTGTYGIDFFVLLYIPKLNRIK